MKQKKQPKAWELSRQKPNKYGPKVATEGNRVLPNGSIFVRWLKVTPRKEKNRVAY